ncbi:hypothetical protein PJP12_30085, partial [Mycobacterium kansasii]
MCEVVDVETCDMLFSGLWKYNIDATHRDRNYIFIFVKDGKNIFLAPMRIENQPKAYKVEGQFSLIEMINPLVIK